MSETPVTHETLPEGSIVYLGHPANGVTARKRSDGKWFHTHYPHREVSYDDMAKAAHLVYAPGVTHE